MNNASVARPESFIKLTHCHQLTLACRQCGVLLRNIGDTIFLMPAPAMPEELVVELCRTVKDSLAEVLTSESCFH